MTENLENSAVATGLEKVSSHSNPKERQRQRMFQLPYNKAHFTCQQGYVQNPSSQVSALLEPRTSRCPSWIWQRQRNQRSNCQHPLDHRKTKGIPEKTSTSVSLTMLKTLCGSQQTVENSERDGNTRPLYIPPEKSVYRLRSNSSNWTWNSRLVPDRKRSTSIKQKQIFFLKLSCFFDDPMDVGNLISGSSAFSKTSWNIWKFTVHVLLKPGLENFEHYFTSV